MTFSNLEKHQIKMEKRITVKDKFIWSFPKLLDDFKRGYVKPRKR